MINTEELILGKDYCNYFLFNPKVYQLMGWEINSEEDAGIIKDKSTNELRFYWDKNFPENEYGSGTMPISERARNPKLEYFYAPYMFKQWDEEALKLYKHMRRVVGCTNGCFFGDSVTIEEKCKRCYEEATKQNENKDK